MSMCNISEIHCHGRQCSFIPGKFDVTPPGPVNRCVTKIESRVRFIILAEKSGENRHLRNLGVGNGGEKPIAVPVQREARPGSPTPRSLRMTLLRAIRGRITGKTGSRTIRSSLILLLVLYLNP